ncbi:MAG: SOS-response repressor and protease LexA [uncultured Gemmatimonadetes bacterium]|uniref:LexA repressor n=1 Tax=uncultured Gemmatimonadota bacterium TaxID=203437 RepID=A0A6J4K9Q3_9BACT|nr:MAG: SOS-response repressor and protease LexA [uncultured Gemmatimonadota bacterium]
MALTKKQRQILDYVESFVDSNGYSPSYEEIADHFGYNSLATVHEHLTNLEQKGFLRKNYNKSRSLEIVRADLHAPALELPLKGEVAAGLPIEAVPDGMEETVTVPHDMVRRGENYVLRVRGDSMIEEQIRDGDYIIVNSRQTAENGEMVVALVADGTVGGSATVKKFYREAGNRIRLQPANETMQPMYFPADAVAIQGIVVGVIRKY